MSYNKNIWSDRIVERPLTFTMQQNSDGTITLIPAEGEVIQSGTALTANKLNNLESQYEKVQAIAQMFKLTKDNGERTYLNEATDISTLNSGIYYLTAQDIANPSAPIVDTSWMNLDVTVSRDGSMRQFTLRRNHDNRSWIGTLHTDGTFRGWKEITTKIATLWSGDSRGDFSSTFTLSESLSNYDFAFIKMRTGAGINAADRFIDVGTMNGGFQLIEEGTNIPDSTTSNNFYLYEYVTDFNSDLKSFKNARCAALAVNGSGNSTRTNNTNDIGIIKIVGVKL
ncbi:hypothetical protein [Niallia sp. RD1]|uniref:hypothetical protein n=1 Tax=Niallia sp. RD1 TaxID=2962858 RepID=UPI0020C19E29|nr:hypothetical protein [Niallia sp. RD1]UTI44441.1 hypothetical protein NKG37_12935 [Niallia sp. RD1]